jgi:hypothetical protein
MVTRASLFWCVLLIAAWPLAGCGRVGVSLIRLGHGGGKNDPGNPNGQLDGGSDDASTDAAAADGGGDSNEGGRGDGSPECSLSFMPDASCGVGHCRTTNTPSSCVAGVETACMPGTPLRANDSTCDGVDDDCDGKSDENFSPRSTTCGSESCAAQGEIRCIAGHEVDSCAVTLPGAIDDSCDGIDENCNGTNDEGFVAVPSTCGVGACESSGTISCSSGSEVDSCVPGTPAAKDGPPSNGIDEDCDGNVDEDACVAPPRTFGPGAYPNITVPVECGHVTVQLWGGGGASGGKSVQWSSGSGGRAGAGGYASSLLAVAGPLTLYVGNGGANGCNAGGTNAGSVSYAGGSGGTGIGNPGGDTVAAGGGSGGNTSQGSDGGRGCYGGGGGGQGAQDQPWDPPGGQGGGGGAATVVLMNGMLTIVAGGGGGSGGEAGGWWGVSAGGTGGDGCSGNGGVGTQVACGAAGGGGLCLGTTTHVGVDGVPFSSASLPMGQASGATDDCAAGGGGYAIVMFSR